MTRALLALALFLGLAGCSHSPATPSSSAPSSHPDVPNMNAKRWANAQELAAKELGTPVGQATHQSLGNGRFVFQAGPRQVELALYCLGWSCVWLDDPRARASFDLNCPREQLAITWINETSRGISGCERRGTYLAKVEQNYAVTWILNSPVQSSVQP